MLSCTEFIVVQYARTTLSIHEGSVVAARRRPGGVAVDSASMILSLGGI